MARGVNRTGGGPGPARGKPRPSASATFTSEFGHEVEAERQAWLRRRFQWYCGAMMVLGLVGHAANLDNPIMGSAVVGVLYWLSALVGVAGYGAAWLYTARRGRRARLQPLRLAHLLILLAGLVSLLIMPVVTKSVQAEFTRGLEAGVRGGGPSAMRARLPMGGEVAFDAGPPSEGGLAALEPEEARRRAEEAARAEYGDASAMTPAARRMVDEAVRKAGERAARNADNARERERVVETMQRSGAMILGGLAGLWTIFASHFLACCFLPWTWRESMRPIWPLLGLNAGLTVWYAVEGARLGSSGWAMAGGAAGVVLLSALTPMPGVAVCAWRESRFKRRMTFDLLRGRYSEIRQELTSARQIHEGLFPKPVTDGPVRFRYAYEPMRQIGGDYLHAFQCPSTLAGSHAGTHSFVLMDVTGHGIPAALTVNRLHGELTRIFAEDPGIDPGRLLSMLNRYVHLTLASHSVYVTAMCFRADPKRDVLEYASGGHPPAFLRTSSGRVVQLDSTTFVLGACPADEFDPEPRTLPFLPGDTVIAYTDGATEARDVAGRYLGVAGLLKCVATQGPAAGEGAEGGWPATLRAAVESHRHGPTADDILVIEIGRTLG